MNKKIEVFDYANVILKTLGKGALLTTKAGDKVNSMTIGWGTLGIEWQTPIFTAFVREGRYTRELLDQADSFTVNIPLEGADRKALGILGSKSGRDMDKAALAGITYVPGEKVESPAVKEYALTIECKLVYKQLQDRNAIAQKFMDCYPQDVDSSNPMENKDFHIVYCGEIVAAYIIQ